MLVVATDRKSPWTVLPRRESPPGLAQVFCLTVAPSPSYIIKKRKPQRKSVSDSFSANNVSRSFEKWNQASASLPCCILGPSCLLPQPSKEGSFDLSADRQVSPVGNLGTSVAPPTYWHALNSFSSQMKPHLPITQMKCESLAPGPVRAYLDDSDTANLAPHTAHLGKHSQDTW